MVYLRPKLNLVNFFHHFYCVNDATSDSVLSLVGCLINSVLVSIACCKCPACSTIEAILFSVRLFLSVFCCTAESYLLNS